MIIKYIFFSPINYMSTLNFQSGVYFGLNRENGNIYRLIEKTPEFLFEKNIYYGLDTSTGNIYRLIDRGVSFNFESGVYYSLDEITGNIYRIKNNEEYTGLIEDYPGISTTRTSIEQELISHGETTTIIDSIKQGMTSLIRDTRGTKTRMILHENSKNNLRDVILRGSNKLNKRVRRRASLKMLFEQNIYVKEFKFDKVDLDLPEKFKKERAIVFRNDETVKIKDLASDEGFYSVLDNNENIHFELGDKLLTYTRNDDGDTERYNLTIGLEGHDDVSIEDSPENYNIVSNNNLYVDDEIKINVGGNVRIFLIGSIGDGGIGTVDGSIYLSAGNRVYIDNTQSNTAANTALKIDGGALIKKDTWFGKDLNIVDNGTILGDTSNLEVEELVETTKKEGAKVLLGGKRPAGFNKGFYYEPTIFDNVKDDFTIMKVEPFGPLVPMLSFKSFDEVIERANNNDLGLSSYICTNSMEQAHRASELMETGTVAVNTPLVAIAEAPFGGIKQTGYGREGGSMAIKDYLNIKYTHFGISYE